MNQQKNNRWTKQAALALAVLMVAACGEKTRVEDRAPSPQVKEKDPEVWPTSKSPELSDASVEQRVNDLISKMTLEEKVGQITQAEIQSMAPGDVKKYHLGSILNGGGSKPGRKSDATVADWLSYADAVYAESMDDSDGFLAIPVIWGTDAVHGHGNVRGATIFPHNIGLGATRNFELIEKIGYATAKEVRATGIEWVFAPTVAVAQNDLWGRTYESYSEDPDLVAQYGASMVRGMQGKVGTDQFLDPYRVIATSKHFVGDGGTVGGDDQGDAQISENELVNTHAPGYSSTINEGVQSIMASFSSWNGEKMHGNKNLLNDKLREIMGFNGVVVGDWNGHGQVPGCSNESCAQAVNAGIDIMMVPNHWKAFIENTIAQVKSGEITEERLNEAVARVLRLKIYAKVFDKKPSERLGAADSSVVGSEEHRLLARQAVRESLVLLKNKGKILPLKPEQHVVVAGEAADSIAQQSGGWSVTWQGAGLKNDEFPGATSIYSGIKQTVEAAGGSVEYAVDGEFQKKPDVAIVVFGEEPYAEGQGDLNTLEFEPGNKPSLALLKKFKAAGVPVVSVFLSGRPLWVNPEFNQSDAFVAAWLPGTEGQGVADVIFAKPDGSVNYSFKGALSFSWPNTPLQALLNPHHPNYEPLFALGFGLKYEEDLEGPTELLEKVEGVVQAGGGDINFYVGRPLQPWKAYILGSGERQVLSGAYAAIPDGSVKVSTADKDVQEDALKLTWKDNWAAELTFEEAPPMDLSAFMEKGVFSYDLKINDIKRGEGGLKQVLKCGQDCEREVSLDEWAWENTGKDWQSVRVAMSCFVQEGDTFNAVPGPFGLKGGGTGEFEVANIRFLKEGEANIGCPDSATLSVTPAMLNEHWAVSWWEDRHKDKLEQVKAGNIDLVFIGDSITQGWEKEGLKAWEKFYGKRNALNLGFSGDRTENVLWRLDHGEVDGISPKVAVLMIGTNNTGHRLEKTEYTAAGIKKILDTLKEKLPKTKVLLLAIFPRAEQPNHFQRLHNKEINKLIAGYADNKHTYFLNINKHFLDDKGVLQKDIMPDLLHLNEKSYGIWAEKMEPTLKKLLAK